MTIKNAFTVDVEDYFQVSAFADTVAVSDWEKKEMRVEASMNRLLALLDKHHVKATFFTLGWVAERYPQLIKNLAQQGHEIASHGYWHQRATGQTTAQFKEDVGSARKLLQDLTGCDVHGYRAPSFSIDRTNEWAYDVLLEEGYQYSSSIYPVSHDHYGVPDAPRFKYKTEQGLWEVPLSTLVMNNKNIPISGGGYFRLYPYRVTSWAIKRFHDKDTQPYIFYMHPWEIDPGQPRQQGLSFKSKFRHYLNLGRVESRLDKMLQEFKWSTMADSLDL